MGEASDDVRDGWSRGWFAGLLFRTAEVDRLRRDLAVAEARIEAVDARAEVFAANPRASWSGEHVASEMRAALTVPVTGNNEHQGEQR